jgi:hypothetical protein
MGATAPMRQRGVTLRPARIAHRSGHTQHRHGPIRLVILHRAATPLRAADTAVEVVGVITVVVAARRMVEEAEVPRMVVEAVVVPMVAVDATRSQGHESAKPAPVRRGGLFLVTSGS